MKQVNTLIGFITKPTLSTLTISPVGTVITIEDLVDWDGK